MHATHVILALALIAGAASFMPTAAATPEPICDDRSCLVSVEMIVCVTEPCDDIIVCVAYGRYCTNDL